MSQYLKLYLITLAMFLAMDFVWLKIVARSFYQNQLGYLLADKVKYLPIVLFYLFFCSFLLCVCCTIGPTSGGSVRHGSRETAGMGIFMPCDNAASIVQAVGRVEDRLRAKMPR